MCQFVVNARQIIAVSKNGLKHFFKVNIVHFAWFNIALQKKWKRSKNTIFGRFDDPTLQKNKNEYFILLLVDTKCE